MNSPDLFHRPDGWYRSEFRYIELGPLCFGIKDNKLFSRDYEANIAAILAGKRKGLHDYCDPLDFVPLGTLTFICDLNGRPHKNDWENDLELE